MSSDYCKLEISVRENGFELFSNNASVRKNGINFHAPSQVCKTFKNKTYVR